MKDTVKDRLKKYLRYSGVSEAKFAEAIGVSPGYVSAIRKSIQPDKANSIARFYPDLNIEWLLTGNGEMLKTTIASDSSNTLGEKSDTITMPIDAWNIIKDQVASLKTKDEHIEELIKSMRTKDRQIDELIDTLKKEINKKGEDADALPHAAARAAEG